MKYMSTIKQEVNEGSKFFPCASEEYWNLIYHRISWDLLLQSSRLIVFMYSVHFPTKQIARIGIVIPFSTSHHVDFRLQISISNITRKMIHFHNCHKSDSFLHLYRYSLFRNTFSETIIPGHQQILLRRCLTVSFWGSKKICTKL